ncbi:MAG: CHAT domain-containing tetratricopeptide repeat protein [Bacteroidota bacterium]
MEGLIPEQTELVSLDSIYKVVGDYFFSKNEGESCLYFFLKRKLICEQLYGKSSLEVSRCFADIGKVLRYRLSRYHEAKEALHQGLLLAEANGDSTSRSLFNNYYWLASSYNRIKDFSNARIYALAAYELAVKLPHPNISERSKGLLILGTIHGNLHRRQDAIKYYSELIPIEDSIRFDSRNSDYLYNNLGGQYIEVGDFVKGKKALLKSYTINKEGKGGSALRLTLRNLAAMYYMSDMLDSSLYYYHKALKLNNSVFPDDRLQSAHFNRALGGVFFRKDQLDSALIYYQEALKMGFDNFNQDEFNFNPLIKKNHRNDELFILLSGKGKALLNKFHKNPQDKNWLLMALDCYNKADSVIMMNRAGIDHEASKLNMASVNYRQVYADAINCAFLLDSLTPDPKFRDMAFRFMEKNKSMILLEAISKNSFSRNSEVDPDLRQKELDHIEAVSYNEEMKRLVQRKVDAIVENSNRRNELEIQLNKRDSLNKISIALDQAGELLKKELREKAPNYADQKYDQEFSGLNDISSSVIKPGMAILEYFKTDSAVYALSFFDGTSSLKKIKLDQELKNSIYAYKRALREGINHREDETVQFKRFTESALLLYRKLIQEPLVNKLEQVKSLIIVPDDILADLPFESFLVKLPEGNRNDYSRLEYLFQKLDVSYALSLNVLSKSKEGVKSNKIKPKVLGFSYLSTEKVGALPGASKEIEALKTKYKGSYFSGDDATVENFKLNVIDKDVIHLAIHGKADTTDNYASCLYFVPEEKHDGKLFAYDLYNLRIDADLIVLSACESGIGAKAEGEGTYSIARGFAFSGCPTQVITLWSIKDKAAVDLMQAFYSELIKEKPVGKALSLAKKKLVKQYDEYWAHPSNWAAFIVLGNPETAFKS